MRENTKVLDKVYDLISSVPLCPSCLGRAFASLLRGYSNKERGLALLRSLVMQLERGIEDGDEESREKLAKIASRLPPEFKASLERKGIEYKGPEACWLCGGRINDWVNVYKKAANMLRELRADSFVVGVTLSKSLAQREDELYRLHMITTGESIRQELKREIGKRVTLETGIPVDFERPGVVVMVMIPQGIVYTMVNPLLITGRYLKTGRNISQTQWVTRSGEKKFDLSVQTMLDPLRQIVGGTELVLHASGREDTDARMLGNGRPMVVEVKEPQRRRLPLEVVEKVLNKGLKWGKVKLERVATREVVREIKTSDQHHRKAYRALIASDKDLDEKNVQEAAGKLRGVTIRQRTPRRVSHRRADIVREKKLHDIQLRLLTPRLLQAYFLADGGLYIKELISGDEGRTRPSLSETLGAGLRCVELDVIWVEE